MKHVVLHPVIVFAVFTGSYSITAQPAFRHHSISVEGRINRVLLRDIDGDGRCDLVVQHTSTLSPHPYLDRIFSFYLQSAGAYNDTADHRLTANEDEILFDIGDLEGDGLQEIVFLKHDGVYMRRFVNGSFLSEEVLILAGSVFAAPDVERVRFYPFLRDINGDGRREILIIQPTEIHLYGAVGRIPSYHRLKRLYIASEYTFTDEDELLYILHLPELHQEDFNGDGYPDLLIHMSGRLDIFLQYPRNPEMTGGLVPPDLRYRFGTQNVSTSFFDPLAPSASFIEIGDLNGDHRADVLYSKASRGSFTSGISQIQIYLNQNNRIPHLPDQVITTENVGAEHLTADIDGDGRLDMATLTYSIGLAQAVKFLLFRKASFSLQFYRMRSDGTYPKRPDDRITFSRKMRIRDLLRSPFCQSLEGDFNGDGIHDLLLATEAGRVSVFPGTIEGLFKKEEVFHIDVPVSSSTIIDDVNKDGVDDLIFTYPEDPVLEGRINLLLSNTETGR